MTDQGRHDGRHGFDSDEGVVLESDAELHDFEEDAERERQHQEALQAARDASVGGEINPDSQSGDSD